MTVLTKILNNPKIIVIHRSNSVFHFTIALSQVSDHRSFVFLNRAHIGSEGIEALSKDWVHFHHIASDHLQLLGALRPLALVVDEKLVLRVLVKAERDRLVLEVVHLVQMSQQQVTDDHQIAGATMHLVLVDGELAALATVLDCLVEEQVRLHLEDLIAERD